jgi:transcriptional regulator GlxA family with amidase domain
MLDWITANLDRPLTVEDMAVRSGLSRRSPTRHFTDQLGVSPRPLAAQSSDSQHGALLEEVDLTVETVAGRVALSSAVKLRRRFRTALKAMPPLPACRPASERADALKRFPAIGHKRVRAGTAGSQAAQTDLTRMARTLGVAA